VAEKVFGAGKSLSLPELEQWIAGKEALWGPLLDIGRNDEGTLGKFDTAADIPDRTAIVRLLVNGEPAPPPPAGAEQLCAGEAFVCNQPVPVAVYR